jgi:hypothetical protein
VIYRLMVRAGCALALSCSVARAADLATSYAVPGFPTASRIAPVITLCPSSDGSNTAVACPNSGGGSGTLPAGAATSANQTTPAAPGTSSATANPVQGVTGGVPVSTSAFGTTGTDYSANAASIPMAGFVLLATIPVTSTRAAAEVQNQSAALIQVVRDDGTGANQTSQLLASGGSVGSAGGGWSSTTFKGRIRVYGPTGSQVAADQE